MSSSDNLMTREGLAELRAELAELEGEGRRGMAERIKTAREWGDLKENAEYHAAKEEQAHLETRIALLRARERSAVVAEEATGASVVGFGSTVTVRDESSGREATYKLVSAHQAKPSDGLLSMDSPVAGALRGARAGDTVAVPAPAGVRRLAVVAIN
ncbi:MAG TPA: transcription elongation factor GreA [Solirubrobacteraceae bacterium]|jgi:transcription elongation factor GreA